MRPMRIVRIFILGAIAVASVWGIVRVNEERKCRILLDKAKIDLAAGLYSDARSQLIKLLERRRDWDEALYHLGVCEQTRNRPESALAAFEKVPHNSTWSGWSEVRRSRLELNRGRVSEAEKLLKSAAEIPGSHVAEARWGLVLILRQQGRNDEARRWLQAGFDVMSSPIETLQRLYKIDVDPFPIEGVRLALNRAGKMAPEDDRVWLGRANLAIREGAFAEADRWLDLCRRRRSDDPAVWRMNLDLAIAAGRPDQARQTLSHLPAAREPATLIPALRAWFAHRQGDVSVEREALRQSLELNPADAASIERLATIEHETGNTAEANRLRQTIPAIDRTRQEYIRRLGSPSPESHAAELAELARRLGRRFDAARWAAIATPSRSQHLKLASDGAGAAPSGLLQPTLADLLPEFQKMTIESGDRSSETPDIALLIPRFTDDAQAAGLKFVQENGAAPGGLIPPVTASGGVALLDYDNDGWLDVFLVQGGAFPPEQKSPSSFSNGDRLFRNKGNGIFEDVTATSGIGAMTPGYGHGVSVGDYDNDGHPDLFVTRWRSYALYHNKGDGTFEDVTAKAGLAADRDWPTSAAFADLDGDGDLDLYVCHYFKWDEHETRRCSDPKDPAIYRCLPLDFEALPDHVFRNDGGRFVDVTRAAGFIDTNGRGLGVLVADLDDDGRVDLFVANDMSANYLYRNLGGFRFEETAQAAGVASNASGSYQAGMGVACGDLDGDGRLDLAVTNFYNESTSYFRNLGQGFFTDQTAAIGLAVPSRYVLGFGIAFLDANNDGWLDLITANGHVHDGRPQFPWMMPVQLCIGDQHGNVADVSSRSGPPFTVLRMGRGLAAGDLDNDGYIDAVIVSQNEPVAYFRNRTTSEEAHFLTLHLEGTTSNRDAVGAKVSVQSGGRVQVATRLGGGSFQSASDPRMHFGLGNSRQVDRVDIHWPAGRVDRFSNLAADMGYRLREGDPVAEPLRGWNLQRARR